MNISSHIKILLFQHNCIIIPGFGGIVMQYSPASIHPSQHIFQPPHKSIAFNKSLTTNDGLLIAHIANYENNHYDEAERLVRRYVLNIENAIRTKGDFVIEDVGKLYKDVEGNIQFKAFEAVNFLLNAYGLEHFISPAIIRREAFEPQQAKTIYEKKKKRFNWFGFFTFFLIACLVVFQVLQISNLLPFIQHPIAGIEYKIFPEAEKSAVKSKANSLVTSPAVSRKDTLVQIIVIRDESNDKNNLTPETKEIIQPLIENKIDVNKLTNVKNYSTVSFKERKRMDDSIRYLTNNITPQKGEYNPAIMGNYLIVFYTTVDSIKALAMAHKLWNDHIGVRVIEQKKMKKYIIAKPGYLSTLSATKDVVIYNLLGYENIVIQQADK